MTEQVAKNQVKFIDLSKQEEKEHQKEEKKFFVE